MMYAILDGKNVVPADFKSWSAWFERSNWLRHVERTEICDSLVSTVFIGLNHGFMEGDRWFETMVFGGRFDGYQRRYETYEEAEVGHDEVCQMVRKFIDEIK